MKGFTLLTKMAAEAARFCTQDPNLQYLFYREFINVDQETLARYRTSGTPLDRYYAYYLRNTFGNFVDSRERMYELILELVGDKNYTIDVEFETRPMCAPLAKSITINIGGKVYKTTLRAHSITLIKE